jgi:tetratricopeptide (TPR) repeat protein
MLHRQNSQAAEQPNWHWSLCAVGPDSLADSNRLILIRARSTFPRMGTSQGVPPVQVVYESEPRDHGAAARALPVLRTDFLRELFAELLRTSDDLNSFALDFFPAVHRQFSSGMTREAREDLLLSGALPLAVYEALRALFGSKVPPPPLADTAARATLPNPYRGLLVFGVQDAPLFFGRAKKTAELRQLFDAAVMTTPEAGPVSPRLVAVLGPSGSGKSSLAQAGLLADLLRKPPIGGSYLAAVLRPQGRPLRALARVLAKLKHASDDWPLSEIDAIVERLHKDPRSLGDLVSDVLTQPEQRLLLVIDQLEELYTMAEPSESAMAERRAFVAALLTAASERRGRVDVVVTLRSDLLGEVGVDPALQQALTTTGRVLLVGSLDAEELAEAITGPAARAGRPLPADAVALLVREAEGQAGALPLLQFTMEKLWRAIDDAPSRPIADLLRELGGVGGSLAQEAEALYRGLHPQRPKLPTDPEPPPSAAQVRARRAFSRLLKTRDGQVLGRRRQALADLVGAGETLAELRAVLDRFVDSRLLVLDGEETEATVEIGHESLGRSWQRLARWLSEASVYLPVLLRISKDARRWHRQGQPDRLLLRSEELAALRRALPMLDASGNLGAREREFAQACLDGIQHRRKRRAAALVEKRVARAVSVARHVVDRVMTRLERVSGTAELRRELLEDAMHDLDELRTELSELENTELLVLRSRGHQRRGDLAMTHDNLTVALREYGAARVIGEGLIQRLPGSSQAQRDFSISLQRLGDVAVKMGQLGEATVWFERSLKISEKLALADANDAQVQRDLSISLNKLGSMAVQMGQLGEAKVWFERSLKISEKLALADANGAQAQRDLSVSIVKLGDVAVQMGQLGEAKVWFERSLRIREKLALADANDAQAQRDLCVSILKLGDVAVQMRQLGEAKAWFERSLKISEKMALVDANDAQAQRDLSISQENLGDVAVQMGQLGEAKAWFERSLKIGEKLALADANDAQAQRDVSISLQRLGGVAVKMGQLGEAKVWFERSLKIREKLALADANDAQAQRDLIVGHYMMADLYHRLGPPSDARSEAQVAATLLARLRPRLTKSDADSIEQALRALPR